MTAEPQNRVLITAGGSGIGHAMASTFETDGAQVWVTDIDGAALAACPNTWQRSEIDAADEASVADLFAQIEGTWGGLDTLCANAGIAGPTAAVEDIELEDWRRCVSVNLEGAFLGAKYATPMMKRQKSGAIIITSSVSGIMANPHRAPYVAAKWGMVGLMKTLAMELGGYNVRANAIAPGAVNGPRMDRVLAAESDVKGIPTDVLREAYASGTSMGTFVDASDIADMAVFLASPRARHVSGQVIAVDGNTVNPDPQI